MIDVADVQFVALSLVNLEGDEIHIAGSRSLTYNNSYLRSYNKLNIFLSLLSQYPEDPGVSGSLLLGAEKCEEGRKGTPSLLS